jgi:eukaryotic-like serine/threonine-protein kinase
MAAIDRGRWQRISPLLDQVLDLIPGQREGWLAALRTTDAALAADLETLLVEHRLLDAERFLEDGAHIRPPTATLAGAAVGAYTLVEPIGQGGMGSVWLASRSDGRFEGRAAVKLLNAEMVGGAGVERFKREGTILARLTHPHIARLTDAGASSAGQPYLVLEHVDGLHIDQYCDEHALGVEARLLLFLDILSAVAHAHANLIVHRDLKPSNVLVTTGGDVKLLDFGVAKLLESDDRPNDPTLTGDAAAGLTPMFAAPEQVTGGAVTTATDIYALGVLLYSLLSGCHPVGAGARSAAEIVKAIVDTEPRRMSSIVADPTTAVELLAERSARRATTPDKLRRLLRGDLDTIVAKALKKNPRERYASVGEYADDVRRFLDHQPIAARPDTFGYRAGKFARRHRRSLPASAVAVLLAGGLIGFYTIRLAREHDRAALQAATASKVSELITDLLDASDPFRTPDAQEPIGHRLLDTGAERIARDLEGQPEAQAEMFTAIGRVYQRIGLSEKALPLLEEALALGRRSLGPDHVSIARSLNQLGVLNRERGDLPRAQALLEESLAMRRRLLGSDDKDVAATLVELAGVFRDRGLDAQAEPLIRESLAIRRKLFGDVHRDTAASVNELALLLWSRGDLDAAEPLLRESLSINVTVLGADHPRVGFSKGNLALLLEAKGDPAAAEELLREDLAMVRKTLGESHPAYAQALSNLSRAVLDQGRFGEAQALLEQALRIVRPLLADDDPRRLIYMTNLARVRIARNQPDKAEPTLRDVLKALQRIYPRGDWRVGEAESLLGAALMRRSRYAEAEPLLLDAARVLKSLPGAQGREAADNRARLGALYTHLDQRHRIVTLEPHAPKS